VVERALRQANHLRSDADPPFVQGLDRDFVAFARFAEDLGLWHAALLEDQLARAAGADAELVLLLPDNESLRAALDDEGGDAAVTGVRIDGREDDEDVGFVGVRDPELPSGQEEGVAGISRPGGKRKRVASGAGLREGVGADDA
jgi:hypothetical protein